MKKQQKKKISEPQVIKRKFCHPTQITDDIICSVCTEAMNDPVKTACNHSFCRSCIDTWLKNQRDKNCPLCRQSLKNKDLKKDVEAAKMVDDLEILCPNNGCSWQGPLRDVQTHIKSKCGYRDEILPDWYRKYLTSTQDDFAREEQQEEQMAITDPKLLEALYKNKEQHRPLAQRLFNANDQEKNQGLKNLLSKRQVSPSDEKNLVKSLKKIHIGGAKKDYIENQIDRQILFGDFNLPSEVEDEPDEMINTADLFSEAEESCMQIRSQQKKDKNEEQKSPLDIIVKDQAKQQIAAKYQTQPENPKRKIRKIKRKVPQSTKATENSPQEKNSARDKLKEIGTQMAFNFSTNQEKVDQTVRINLQTNSNKIKRRKEDS